MIFPSLELEAIVQTDDKTRLRATKSFVSKDEASAITLVEIEPEAASGFIDVTGTSSADWFLDWEYSGATRTVTVSLRVTAGLTGPTTVTKTIEVKTPADDLLFSGDSDLIAKESDILNYVEAGRNSFLKFHRDSQEKIMDHFNQLGIRDVDGAKLTAADVVDVEEVRRWSVRLTLAQIYDDLSNSLEDHFAKKSMDHMILANNHRDRQEWKLDLNNDGNIDSGEGVRAMTVDLVRR